MKTINSKSQYAKDISQDLLTGDDNDNYTATIINKAIINNDSKSVKLDETCKVLLSDVQILAHILKYVVDELNNFTIEEIQTIIPAHISHEPVFPGNRVAKTNSNESIILGEGLLRFDVHFELDIPGTNTRLQINIEAQNSIYNEYEIVTRGVAYTSQQISQQFKTVIRANKYQKMQKVYSI